MPFVSLTRAILRNAELGFLGVMVFTCTQTPRFCGEHTPFLVLFFKVLCITCNAGALVFRPTLWRPFLTSWFTVGILISSLSSLFFNFRQIKKPPSCSRTLPDLAHIPGQPAGLSNNPGYKQCAKSNNISASLQQMEILS
jgi:hypothetical protein